MAMGLDKISARMLKETVSSITPMITAMFNISLSTGTCPDSWKSSLIVPLPKSGDLSNPGNYIGLSPSFPLWVNCLRNTSVISCVNTLTVLTNNGYFRLASLYHQCPLIIVYPPWEWGRSAGCILWSPEGIWYCPSLSLINKLHQLEIPSHLVTSYLHNRVQQVGVLGELSSPTLLTQVYHRVPFWEHYSSWFIQMTCLGSSYLVVV